MILNGGDADTDVDVITGPDTLNTWRIGGESTELESNTLNYIDGGEYVSFSGMESYFGGAGRDFFYIRDTDLAITVNGQGGNNTLVGPSRVLGTNTWLIGDDNTLNDEGDSAPGVSFSNFNRFAGNLGSDHFILQSGNVVNIRGLAQGISGTDSGSDSLTVISSETSSRVEWLIDGENDGLVTGRITNFYDIENLYGGEGRDTFTYDNNTTASISGLIDGGEGTSDPEGANEPAGGWRDILNLEALTNGVLVELGPTASVASATVDGRGVLPVVNANNFERIIGSDGSDNAEAK